MTTNPTTDLHDHAAEVDTRIADAYTAWKLAQRATAHARDMVRLVAGQHRRNSTWTGTFAEAALAADAVAQRTPVTYLERKAQEAIAGMPVADAAEARALAAYQAAEADYAGWSRFFLVTGGHIHSTLACSTCYPTTEFGWLPQLSGLTEADAVAVYGAVLCSVCYPSAPVEHVGGNSDGLTLAERQAKHAERDAAKAEREAKKAAKSLVEPVRFTHTGYTETVRTVAAARTWIKQAIDNRIRYGYETFATPETFAAVDALVAALEAKGIDAQALVAKWTTAAERDAAR